jgi:hypothetical protein
MLAVRRRTSALISSSHRMTRMRTKLMAILKTHHIVRLLEVDAALAKMFVESSATYTPVRAASTSRAWEIQQTPIKSQLKEAEETWQGRPE